MTSNSIPSRKGVLALVPLVLCAADLIGQKPGDVFREYTLKVTPWARAVGHDATASGARALLPNLTHRLTVGDLRDAIRAEVRIEKLTSHVGSADPQIRFNNKSWLDIPFTSQSAIPGKRGDGGIPMLYMTFYTSTLEVPLSHLVQGTNRFQMTCSAKNSTGFAKQWPQFIYYGVTVRVYYKSSKPHATGRFTAPHSGSVLSDDPTFRLQTNGDVRRVEYLGDYNDFNWRGDGTRDWVRSVLYGEIQHHIGTSTSAPWSVKWDTEWIPTQDRPFRVVARVTDRNGMIYMTQPLTGLTLSRSKTVVRYLSDKLPMNWVSNYWKRQVECFSDVTGDLSKAEAARAYLSTWNGYEADEIGINGSRLVRRIGKDHDISWDHINVPLNKIRNGRNQLYTKGSKQSHGIEVQWPGIELFVRYDIPESAAQFAAFGENCAYRSYNPELTAVGQPQIGKVFELVLNGGVPSSPYFLTWGTSNQMHLGVVPLPFPMASLGAPGCTIWTSIERAEFQTTDNRGQRRMPIFVPNDTTLVGAVFFNQALLPVPGANAAEVLTTNGARLLIGR